MGRIAITFECQVREDALSEAESVLADVAAVSGADEGNLVYAVCRSHTDPTYFRVLEIYASPEAVERHRADPGVREAVGRLRPLLAAPWAINVHDVIAEGR